MQKIVPYEISIEIDKSKLTKKLGGRDELEDFKKIDYIKDRLEDYFPITSSEETIAVTKFGKKIIGMDTLIEKGEKEGNEYLFVTLGVGTSKALEDGEHKIIDEVGKVLYKVTKGSNVISNFFCYIKLNKTEDNNNIYLNGSVFLLTRGVETIRHELEDLLTKVVYEKKGIVSIKNTLTPKDVKSYENKIKEIEVEGIFKNNNEFVSLDNIDEEKKKNLKMGFFIKGKGGIINTLKNKELTKVFIKKPKIKARLNFGKTQQTADLDIDTLHITLKEDIIKTKEQFTFLEFKNECLGYSFGIGKPYENIH